MSSKKPPRVPEKTSTTSRGLMGGHTMAKVPAIGDRVQGLGKLSPIKRAPKKEPELSDAAGTIETMKRQLLRQMNTLLRARSGYPTLAERIAREGIGRQRSVKSTAKRTGKPKEKR